MNESIFKKIWNYSITVGQMIMTAIAMAIVTVIVWLLCRPSRRGAYAKAWALSFRREKYSFLYGGKRAYIERRKTMMKAIKNFMNKPITYGAYFKYCTVCASISLALCGWAYYQMSKLNNWVDTKDEESNLEEDEI